METVSRTNRRVRIQPVYNNEPVVIIGGFMSAPQDYAGWQKALNAPAFRRQSFVANIQRYYWSNANQLNFQPHLEALDRAVERARAVTNSKKVWLVCHSGGGTIARLWMGEKAFGRNRCAGFEKVRGAVFLGSPYSSQDPRAQRTASFVNENYPGAYYPGVTYVSVIGKAVFGQRNGTLLQRMAYKCYSVLHPQQPEQWGDGVVTVAAAQMPGAESYVLKNVHHVKMLNLPGYFSPEAMRFWAHHLTMQDTELSYSA